MNLELLRIISSSIRGIPSRTVITTAGTISRISPLEESAPLKLTIYGVKDEIEEELKKQVENISEEIRSIRDYVVGKDKSGRFLCYCTFCGKFLFKVQDISHFMRGTHKCEGCGKMLQIPKDLSVREGKK